MSSKLSSSFSYTTPLSSLILLLIFFNIFHSTIAAAAIIQKTCRKCEKKDPNINYGFCISSFQADSDSKSADLRKLGAISFSLVQSNVSGTVGYVNKLLQKKDRLDSYRKSRLSDCLELYSDAHVALDEGKKEYEEKRYEDANIKVSSVMDAARVCEDGFGEKNGVPSPLTKRNKDTFQLTAIALSIINMHP